MSTGANGEIDQTVISGDGRFVAFVSSASNHVNGMVPYRYQSSDETVGFNSYGLYVYDRLLDRVTFGSPVSYDSMRAGSGRVDTAAMSYNGSVIAYLSFDGALVANDANERLDFFARVVSPPTASVQVGDGSAQRSVVRSVTVTLDQPVLFAGEPAAAFVLRRGIEVVPVSASVTVGLTTTVTLTFSGPATQFGSLTDGRYTLTVLSSEVTGIEPLDGNADGTPGDDFVFAFHRLFGDADGDARVDAIDFLAFRLAFAQNSPAFDHDGNGTVSASDFLAFRLRFLAVV